MRRKGDVLAVVGGQYGSEGKGNCVAHVANRYDIHVRTGGPNAGHSHQVNGRIFKQQVVPVGWSNPNARIVIGIGGLVPIDMLVSEVKDIMSEDTSIVERLYIDGGAGVLDHKFHEEEGGTDGTIHQRIGSTGEGVGAARRARLRRDSSFRLMRDALADLDAECDGVGIPPLSGRIVENTSHLLREWSDGGLAILLEGTQGSGLSLIHGPWPFCTSADTNAAQLAADAGIPPHRVTSVLLVVRTYPIRVAGNSGPLDGELTWEEMKERIPGITEERTTVTNKVRRIADWDEVLLRRALTLNDPTSIALNFVDYLSPEDTAKDDFASLSERSMRFVTYLETTFGVPVSLIGTGGDTWQIIDRGLPL
jgi:adenylosuccinate synthase